MKDSVDLFFMQIQGSGRIRLPDGNIIRVHYDGKNGHPYTSIGRYLIDNKIMPADKVSLDGLANWLRADPERGSDSPKVGGGVIRHERSTRRARAARPRP